MIPNPLQRTLGVMVKEFRQVRRDIRTLALLLFLPAMLVILYGYALTFDVKHIATAVLNRDGSLTSRQFVDGLMNSEYFDLVAVLNKENEADRCLDDGTARVVLVIPPDFGNQINRAETADVQILIDGSNSNSATVAKGYLEAMIRRYNTDRAQEYMNTRGIHGLESPISVHPRVWYNPTLDSSRFLIPGIIGFLLMLVGTVATALSVVREKERGTMEQILVSPVTSTEFIIGKTLPYLIVCLITTALIVFTAVFMFDVPLQGSIIWLFVTSTIFLTGALGFGLFISTVADTQQVAFMQSIVATMLPSMILSDFIFPIRSMPDWLQWFTYIIPPRHFIVIMRSVFLKGAGVDAWLTELLVLIAFTITMIGIASVRMKRGNA